MPKAGITTVIAILVPALALFPFDVVIYFIRRLMSPEGHGIVVLSFWNVICRRHHSTSLIDGPLLIIFFAPPGCEDSSPSGAPDATSMLTLLLDIVKSDALRGDTT